VSHVAQLCDYRYINVACTQLTLCSVPYVSHVAQLCDYRYSNVAFTHLALSSVPYVSHAAQLCDYRYSHLACTHLALCSVPCMTAMPHSYTTIITTTTVSIVAAATLAIPLPTATPQSAFCVQLTTAATQFCTRSVNHLLTTAGAVCGVGVQRQ
jgi:hypothetical protein